MSSASNPLHSSDNNQTAADNTKVMPDYARTAGQLVEVKDGWVAVILHSLAAVPDAIRTWPPGFSIAALSVVLLFYLGGQVLTARDTLGQAMTGTVILVLALLMAVIGVISLFHHANHKSGAEESPESRNE